MSVHIPAISTLSANVIRLLGCNPGKMTLQGTNTYLIGTGKGKILIDTGEANVSEYIVNLKKILLEKSSKLTHIIITHWHSDHIGGLNDILNKMPEFVSDCKVWKYKRTNGGNVASNCGILELKNGQRLSVEGATLRVEHTPGHTSDHISLLLEEENALFSGDCILGEGTPVFEDLHDYMLSLRHIQSLNPAIIYPGHGPVVRDSKSKIDYYIEHRQKREEHILNELKNKSNNLFSEMDLVKIVYRETPVELHLAASFVVNHHLQKLLKENKVVKINDMWKCKL